MEVADAEGIRILRQERVPEVQSSLLQEVSLAQGEETLGESPRSDQGYLHGPACGWNPAGRGFREIVRERPLAVFLCLLHWTRSAESRRERDWDPPPSCSGPSLKYVRPICRRLMRWELRPGCAWVLTGGEVLSGSWQSTTEEELAG